MKLTSKDLILPALSGVIVYYFFPQIKQVLVGGNSSGVQSGGVGTNPTTQTGQSITDTGVTKKQLSFIGNQLDTSNEIKVSTTALNNYKRATITSSIALRVIMPSISPYSSTINPTLALAD